MHLRLKEEGEPAATKNGKSVGTITLRFRLWDLRYYGITYSQYLPIAKLRLNFYRNWFRWQQTHRTVAIFLWSVRGLFLPQWSDWSLATCRILLCACIRLFGILHAAQYLLRRGLGWLQKAVWSLAALPVPNEPRCSLCYSPHFFATE